MHPRVIAMLGDSLTEFNRWDDVDPDSEVVNFGLSGDTTGGLIYRLNRVALARPNLILLQVGINDLSQGRSPLEIVAGHERIWAALAAKVPGAALVVCSLAPLKEDKFGWSTGTLRNDRVREANALLAEAARRASLEYLDLYGPLSGPDGALPDRMTDDGVHLTAPAYEVWTATVKAYLAGRA
jgi:lysophospholipase L1-like esterase